MSTMITGGGGGGGTVSSAADLVVTQTNPGDIGLQIQSAPTANYRDHLLDLFQPGNTTSPVFSVVNDGNITTIQALTASSSTYGYSATIHNAIFRDATTTSVTATTQLSYGIVLNQISSSSAITMTSAPTVQLNDYTDKFCEIKIYNAGNYNITFQDNATLAGSKLSLSSSTIVLAPKQTLTLGWIPALQMWRQLCAVI